MFTVPDKKILRKMGYLRDQKGILNRYLREQKQWEEHLGNSRQFILSAMEKHNPSKLRVLGSGWLIDFPLEEVYRICPDIELYDVNHPSQVIHKLKRFPAVKCIKADITAGLIDKIYNTIKTGRKFVALKEIDIPEINHENDDIFYISLNILNQLDILLIDYLKRHITPGTNELTEFRRKVQQAHIDFLQQGKYCLISDFSEILINREGEEIPGKQLVYGRVDNYRRKTSWRWQFDSTFSYYSQYKTVFEVKAFSC